MRIHEAIHNIVHKFSPMTDKSSEELSTAAGKEYYSLVADNEKFDQIEESNRLINEKIENDGEKLSEKESSDLINSIQVLPKLGLLHKLARYGEKWWVRYLIGMFFIVVVKKIQDSQNATPPADEFDD